MFDTGVIYVYSDIPDVISFISPWVMGGRVALVSAQPIYSVEN